MHLTTEQQLCALLLGLVTLAMLCINLGLTARSRRQ